MAKRVVLILTICFCGVTLWAQSVLKIVSLSPVVSKSIILLEEQDNVVGCTKWCPFAEEKAVVANAIDVNVEQVVRLKPDVVFASTLTSKESIQTLKDLGIEVVVMPRMTSFESMCEDLIVIAEKLGCKQKAEEEIAIARERLIKIKEKLPEGETPKLMFQVGVKPIFVAIKNTFVEEYITQVGGINIYGDLSHGTVTRESVLKRNPEAIFIATMPGVAENEKEVWLSYDQLNAAKDNQVFLIDQELASSPTVRTYVDVVEIMMECLYGVRN